MAKKIALFYISRDSGHHRASSAVEKALNNVAPEIETANVNAFTYTNPIIEKIVNRAYMGVIRNRPEFWGFLYDNPAVVERTRKLRENVNSSQACKLQTILGKDALAAVCTQAFPCGLVSSYKKNIDPNIKLFAVLTDYAPHSFWIYDNVDTYFVPAEEIGESLIRSGVPRDRISVSGIPIDPVFGERLSKDQAKIKCGFTAKGPVLLLMGGSQGVGAMKDVLLSLASKKTPFQVAAIAGKNKALYSWLKRFADSNLNANLNVHPFMYVDKINELMDASDIIISKPGGITTAEAFSKGLPLFIISPIPGQEQMNTDFFLKRGIAVMLGDPRRAFDVIDSYASNISRLSEISRKASSFSKPDSAAVIARRVLEIVGTGHAVSV